MDIYGLAEMDFSRIYQLAEETTAERRITMLVVKHDPSTKPTIARFGGDSVPERLKER